MITVEQLHIDNLAKDAIEALQKVMQETTTVGKICQVERAKMFLENVPDVEEYKKGRRKRA